MKEKVLEGFKLHLVETKDDLKEMVSRFNPKVMCGVDTETDGLEYKSESVAGICLSGGTSYADYRGYYIPLRHKDYPNNLPVDLVMKVVQWVIDNFQTVFFNRNFDLSMMEYDGLKVPFVGKMQDAQIMAFLLFNEKYPSLKDYSRRLLKWKVIDFEDVAGDDHNFKSTDPTVSFTYAALDPVMTVCLAKKMWNDYPYIRKIYKLDNLTLEAVRRMMKSVISLDYNFLRAESEKNQQKLNSIQGKIYAMSGVYGFNIDSAKEKADVLSRFVTLTEKTAKGKFKVDEDTLAKLNHPLANMMLEFTQTRVYLKNFVNKLLSYEGRPVRFNYNTVNVPSGRLSSGTVKGNPFFVNSNAQNFPKEEVKLYLHPDPSIGYCLKDTEEGCIRDGEGNPIKIKTKSGLRKAFCVPDDSWVWMTADYSGEELRLAANFSREPNFIVPLKEGKDLHTYVAKTMFGFEDPAHRTNVKITNFCVGGNSFILTDHGYLRPSRLTDKVKLVDQRGDFLDWAMEVRKSKTMVVYYGNGVFEEYDYRHKVQVLDNGTPVWKMVSELTDQDRVLYCAGMMRQTSDLSAFSPFAGDQLKSLMFVIGVYLMTGRIVKRAGIRTVVLKVRAEGMKSLYNHLDNLGAIPRFKKCGEATYVVEVQSKKLESALRRFVYKGNLSNSTMSALGKDLFLYMLLGIRFTNSHSLLSGRESIHTTNVALLRKLSILLIGFGNLTEVVHTKGNHNHLVYEQSNGLLTTNVVSRTTPEDGKNIYVIETQSGEYLSSNIVSHNSKLYGAKAPTIAQRTGLPLDEAKRLSDHYDKTMNQLTAWKTEIVKQSKKRGYATTYFGRPVYLLKFLSSSDPKMQAYAERLAVNATIQGPVTLDTRVVTAQGYITMKELVDGGRLNSVFDCSTFKDYTPVYSGKKQIYKLTFDDGSELKAGKGHQLYLKFGGKFTWMNVESLKKDDLVASPMPTVYRFETSDESRKYSILSDKMLYLLPFVQKSMFSTEEGEVVMYFRPYLRHVVEEALATSNITEFNLTDVAIKKPKYCELKLQHMVLSSLIRELGKDDVPEVIFSLDSDKRQAWVEGLLDSDRVVSSPEGIEVPSVETGVRLKQLMWTLAWPTYLVNRKIGAILRPQYESTAVKFGVGKVRAARRIDRFVMKQVEALKEVGATDLEESIVNRELKQSDLKKGHTIFTYRRVVKVEVLPEEDVYCLTVHGKDHRFITNEVVSHNCMPPETCVNVGGKIQPLYSLVGDRVNFSGQVGIPTYRGHQNIVKVQFESGDFCICSEGHKFKEYKSDLLVSTKHRDRFVELVKPDRKRISIIHLFKGCKLAESLPAMTESFISNVSISELSTSLYVFWVKGRTWKILSPRVAGFVRSVVNLCGFNMVCVGDSEYALRWSRKSKTKISEVTNVGLGSVMSPVMLTGYQTYPLSGFVNKNTGADLMRMGLVKFEMLRDSDPEWRENTRFTTTVHDEVNFYVKKSYLKKAFEIIKQVMNFKPDNFEVPIEVEIGVGLKGWGDCIDVIDITDDNKLIPKDYPHEPKEICADSAQ